MKSNEDTTPELPSVVQELASLVAVNGDQVEHLVRDRNTDEQQLLYKALLCLTDHNIKKCQVFTCFLCYF